MGNEMKNIAEALKPYGYEWLVSATGIAGPGSMIVVFASLGDFYTACLTHDDQVVWVMTCGGQEIDANTDECNELHATTRKLYLLPPRMTEEELMRGLEDLMPPEPDRTMTAPADEHSQPSREPSSPGLPGSSASGGMDRGSA